jgi:hypothetical protein
MKKIIYILIILSFLSFSKADNSIKTISYTPCTEADSFFNSNNCQYYSSFFANVNVIGGGMHEQEINFVANPTDQTLVITNNNVGAISCPGGVGCADLNPPITISVIRSPLPSSSMRVIPGGNISFGFAYALTLDTEVTKSGMPYAYQIYEADTASAPGSSCAFNNPSLIVGGSVNPSILQANCGVGDLSSVDLMNTCGNPSLAPSPTGWLTDNGGNSIYQCEEICCGQTESVRIRQLAPYCYAYRASGIPVLVVDFLIRVESPTISGGMLDIPIFGSINIGDAITVTSNGVRVTVTASQLIPTNLLESTISSGWVVVCGEDPNSALPNELAPTSDISNVSWFFQPSDYIPYYGDQTNGQAKTTIPVAGDEHTETYGMSGNDVMQLILKYALKTGAAVSECTDLSIVIPNVPGYDTDNPITPASIYNIPSYCMMWNEARSGNLAFLPPASILPGGSNPLFNWMIKKNIGSISNPDPSNGASYIIYFPNQDQIDASQYKNDLIDAIQFQIDFAVGNDQTFPYVTNYGNVSLPVQIVQSNTNYPGTINKPVSTPTCHFQYPPEVDPKSNAGGGYMSFQLMSNLQASNIDTDDITNQIANIVVSLSCTGVTNAGYGNLTASVGVTSASPIDVPPLGSDGVSDIIRFNLSASFSKPYASTAVRGSTIATCVATVNYGSGSFDETFQCQVSTVMDNIDGTPQKCSFTDLSCQKPLWKSGFFWIMIVVAMILLAIIGVLIWEIVKWKKRQDRIRDANAERMKIERQKRTLLAKEEIAIREGEVQKLKTLVE